jgi:rhodanese-related sulfurtransferase
MVSAVMETPPAPCREALEWFSARLAFETDCWDVHAALEGPSPGFTLLDVRSPARFAAGHVPGAVNLPHGKIIESKLRGWPEETLFVVYCAGPHCNGADKAARRLARLGRPVKLMIGGVTGWLDEGFTLTRGSDTGSMAPSP